jgi:hypothetical protein
MSLDRSAALVLPRRPTKRSVESQLARFHTILPEVSQWSCSRSEVA